MHSFPLSTRHSQNCNTIDCDTINHSSVSYNSLVANNIFRFWAAVNAGLIILILAICIANHILGKIRVEENILVQIAARWFS